MTSKKTQYIGARFTEEEKQYIQKFSEERSLSTSELLREAIFSHINFLKELDGQYKEFRGYIVKKTES